MLTNTLTVVGHVSVHHTRVCISLYVGCPVFLSTCFWTLRWRKHFVDKIRQIQTWWCLMLLSIQFEKKLRIKWIIIRPFFCSIVNYFCCYLLNDEEKKIDLSTDKTRMHSSMMRTARSLPYGGGSLCPGGWSLSRGVLCPGGSLSRRVFVQAGLCSGGSLFGGGVSAQGALCTGGRGSSWQRPLPPWTESQTCVKTLDLSCRNFVAGGYDKIMT